MKQYIQRMLRSLRNLDLLLGVLVLLLALAVRLPYLQSVPRLTEEYNGVFYALRVANGQIMPLTGVNTYSGPFFPYLLAVLFRLFGTSTLLPRLTVALAGTFTCVAVFFAARVIWNRTAGLIAAGFSLTLPFLVLFSSHIAFPDSFLPLFFTLTLTFAYLAKTRAHWAVLPLAGLFAGLSLQAHPASALGLLGIGVWYLADRNALRRLWRRETLFALLIFLLITLPWLASMLTSKEFLREMAAKETRGIIVPVTSVGDYAGRFVGQALKMTSMIDSGPMFRMVQSGQPDPWLAIALVVAVVAFGFALKRDRGILAAVMLAVLLLGAVALSPFSFFHMRYFSYLGPVAFIAVGGLAESLLRQARLRFAPLGNRYAYPLASGLLFLAAGGVFLPTLKTYYDNSTRVRNTNVGYYQLLSTAITQKACGKSLFVQSAEAENSTQLAVALGSIHYVLSMEGCKHNFERNIQIQKNLKALNGTAWIIVDESIASTLSGPFRLERLMQFSPFPGNDPGAFALYRVTTGLSNSGY